MKKIIYIYDRFFTVRDYHRLGAEYLEKQGYEVEVWVVRIEQKQKVNMKCSSGMYEGKNIYDLTWWEFNKQTKKNKDAVFILFEYESLIYMFMMAKYKCAYFLIRGTGKLFFNGTNLLRVADIKNSDSGSVIRKKYRQILMCLSNNLFKKNLPLYAFLGVEVNEKWEQYMPIKRKIYIHAFDYDRYLETKGEEDREAQCIVYVDSGFGNIDIDGIITNYNNPWYGSKNIWNKLEKVFDALEEYYHLPVIVAGHPHTKYTSNVLCKRKIIFNRTPELIASCKFVIMQWSTIISLALLHHKDILILIDNDFKKVVNWNNFYNANYRLFGITPCNMDVQRMAQTPWKYIHKINTKLAEKYINTYVKMPGTPNKLFIEVVEEKIRKIEQNG